MELDLANWMGQLEPIMASATLLDVAMPGAHDAMTYDLSDTLSDGYEGMGPVESKILHAVTPVVAGRFVREWGQTQGMSITSMLDSGIRFIDFRIMYSDAPDRSWNKDWYCLHGCQTRHTALSYLQEAKAWLHAHPKELVVFWASRHGSESATGTDQYPSTTPEVRQAFFKKVRETFGDLLFDTAKAELNSTSVASLLHMGQRVVWFAADYVESTASSNFALDAKLIDNTLPGGGPELGSLLQLREGRAKLARDKAEGKFLLMSMATTPGAGEDCIIEAAAEIAFNPFWKDKHRHRCAQCFGIPEMSWCPGSLQEVGQLTNYYNQIALEYAFIESLTDDAVRFPNAIYIDGIDSEGSIRTGTARINPLEEKTKGWLDDHGQTRYSYAATVIGATVHHLCRIPSSATMQAACAGLAQAVQAARAAHPYQRWNDTAHGRLDSWPDVPKSVDALLLV